MNNFNQSEIFKSATPAQKILWNDTFLKYGDNLAIQQFVYSGSIGASEFVTFNSRRLFLAYQLDFSYNTGAATANIGYIKLIGQLGGANNLLLPSNSIPVWNTTAAAVHYVLNTINILNISFFQIVTQFYTSMNFIGFRITF